MCQVLKHICIPSNITNIMDRMNDDNCCWICLEEGNDGNPLVQPCKCPRYAHRPCVARWQFERAGKTEERYCRFCNERLRNWNEAFVSPDLKPYYDQAMPSMAVKLGDQTVRLYVLPGEEGRKLFLQQIRDMYHIDDDVDFDVTFGCSDPANDNRLVYLKGDQAYDAAVACATISLAKNLKNRHNRLDRIDRRDESQNDEAQSGCMYPFRIIKQLIQFLV